MQWPLKRQEGSGLRKKKRSRKIDAIVALSMACVAAVDTPVMCHSGLIDVGNGCRSAEDIQTEVDREHDERREVGIKWLADRLAVDRCYFPGD